jgi:hypothetical protein
MSETDLGRKVFFLYPPSVIRDELIRRLLDQEYEVYMLKDIKVIDKLVRKYPDAICFANIDSGLDEAQWEEWIRKTVSDPVLGRLGIGIVTYNQDEALQKKYLMDIGIQCGFVKLKLGLEESTKILLATLAANEAKGRRKYVRANCVHDAISGINVREGPIQATGKLRDISVIGFSCVLDPDPEFRKNTVLHDIQLKLRATLVRTQAVILGSRQEGDRTVYVMIFPPSLDGVSRDKIRTYIQSSLQSEIEREADQEGVIVPEAKANGEATTG